MELVEYEEYVEANSEDHAEELFKNSLEKELIEPINIDIGEFEVELSAK